ncbi:MAG: thioredoxin-disulfide reductase [Endomicrobium sp.]|jgi:thioredoxin reductase (NADPH)|nr:thioredoxin-disulfide reductase [Endomicrobium sp.]
MWNIVSYYTVKLELDFKDFFMIYDVIIVGGGPAGLSAAIYASRSKLSALLLEENICGGHVVTTNFLDNYPGFHEGINGFDFAVKLEAQARRFGVKIIYDKVLKIDNECIKKVITINSIYEGRSIIIAVGTHVREMKIPGEAKFKGNGVSFCATCDAPFYKNKNVLVVGGSDSATQESIYLSKFARSVTIVYRGSKLRSTKILYDKVLLHKNIFIMYNTILKKICGSDYVEKVIIMDVNTKKMIDLKIDGVFVFIGLIPNTSFISNIKLDDVGYVLTDENMCTSIAGVLACGDIRKKRLRQVVTAVSDGAQAAVSAQYYIENL